MATEHSNEASLWEILCLDTDLLRNFAVVVGLVSEQRLTAISLGESPSRRDGAPTHNTPKTSENSPVGVFG